MTTNTTQRSVLGTCLLVLLGTSAVAQETDDQQDLAMICHDRILFYLAKADP